MRKPDSDADVLRITASAANEASRCGQPPAGTRGSPPRSAQVAQRYGRVLRIDARELHDALDEARAQLHGGASAATRQLATGTEVA